MSAYIDNLNRLVQEAERERTAAISCAYSPDSRVSPDWVPIAQQIEQLMRTLTPAQLARPWTMEEFVMRLSGRYHDRPHPMHVGSALRQLGWRCYRDWSSDGQGRRYWTAVRSSET